MPVSQGILERRWGYSSFTTGLTGNATRLYKYQNDSDGTKRIIACGTNYTAGVDEAGVVQTANILTPVAAPLRMAFSRDYAFFTDGASQQKKWISGGSVTGWGGTALTTAITYGANNAGTVTLLHGRRYYCVAQNSTTGHYTDLNAVSVLSAPICNQTQVLNLPAAHSDSQFDKKVVLASTDGGDPTLLFVLATVSAATATYEDTTPDTSLVLNNVALITDDFGRELGVALNTPPPANLTIPTKHQGRLWGAVGRTVYFSKSIDELTTTSGLIAGRYEECWPATYFFDVSEEAETVKALFSDGSTLYIGSERHIRRLEGNSPLNFQKPETVFSQVGVMNHDVWKQVFIEGTPTGTMWITPDFRVIFSDFNVYKDVGTPIQDVLNTINPAALANCWAMFVSTGEFDLYILALPTGVNTSPDTLCVFDMRSQKWYIWLPTSQLNYGLFNVTAAGVPQWLTAGTALNILRFNSATTTDSGTLFPVTMRTTWYHAGEPTSVKVVNEIEVYTEDAGLRVSIEGASNAAGFNSPKSIRSSAPLVVAPPPTKGYKLYCAQADSAARYHRYTFVSNSTVTNVLEAFSIEYAPFGDN